MDGKLLKGLTRKNPPAYDKSMKAGPNNMGSDPTRGGTAPTPRTLGPREA